PTFSVAGKMGYVPGISPIYIGFLSRFSALPRTTEHSYFMTAIISGPEPAREKFSLLLEHILLQFDEPCLLIRGVPSDSESSTVKKKNLTIHHFLSTAALNEVIQNSKYIISRSGYSSIMDFIATQSRVLFVPTPGQPEQEFLAKHLHDQFASVYLEQSDLSPSAIRSALKQVKPLGIKSTGNLLQEAFRSITFAAN
ncbi:MAG: glycosyltransferase, partial [Cyclobacteriaceae bacterium]